jgi:hypothetical protein
MVGRSWRRISAATMVLGLFCAETAQSQTPTPIPEQQYQPRPIPLGVSGGALDSLSAPPVNCIGGTLGALVVASESLPAPVGVVIAVNIVRSSCTASAEMVAQASDLQKAEADAEAVRKRHLDELMKIPHVTGVSLDVGSSEIIIDVWVDKPANVSEVERRVPSKLEGYDVDVLPEATGIGA